MEWKTKVEMLYDDQYKEYKKGEKGYIDGYVRGGEGRPYAAVVIGERLVLCMTQHLKVITPNQNTQLTENK